MKMSAHNTENYGSIVVGFILAVCNQLFGWFHSFFLQVPGGTHVYFQALITGSIGALGAFLMNRLLRFIEKKFKNDKNAKTTIN